LKHSTVAVVGCGGLGVNVVTALASAGVGRLVLIDGDVPDVTNLNRQYIYREGQTETKAMLAATWVRDVNPAVQTHICSERLNEKNAGRLLADCELLMDCLDSIAARLILSDYAVAHRKVLIHGGVNGWSGEVTAVDPGRTPCLRCFMENLHDQGAVPSVGAAVSAVGAIEASQAIMVLTGTGQPLYSRLMSLDLYMGSVEIVHLDREPSCSACGKLGL